MTLFRYLFLVFFATIISWAAVVIVLFSVDPFTATPFGLGVFYASGWFAVSGILALIGFFARRWIEREGSVVGQVVDSFRQGLLLSLLVMLTLFLQALRIITWWNVGLAVLTVALFEVFFVMRAGKRYETRI